ncbi:MAG: class I SAM-dependent methyltransferase [Alphaproteobacteria bacterium]|nr:MAG: class I SAM-dependent methyltransferase [Alphaproteobacteria bacterium]
MIRDLRQPLPDAHFLNSELAARWMAEGRLVPFERESSLRVTGRRFSFVTQPAEWTDAQLFDAARLTLALQAEAVEAGYDLKDASAWNVLFDGCSPVFCDLLSFELLVDRPWWAYGQFARQFLLPLLASRRVGLKSRESFCIWRDGMPPESARRLLGWPALLSRYGALLARPRAPAFSSVDVVKPRGAEPVEALQNFRRRLHATAQWQLEGVRPVVGTVSGSAASAGQGWSDYEGDRPHYGGASLDRKRAVIDGWMERLSPAWVLDLGCNTGEFSRMALARGFRVIALDSDHDSVQRLYLAQVGEARLYPLVAPLDDLRSSRGWGGQEHPGLDQRLEGSADLVLMLALIHHLAIGASVPMDEVARFAYRCSRDALVLEVLQEDDPQLVTLCRQRRRDPSEFSAARQRAAFFEAGFKLAAEEQLDGAARSLLLWTK